jgi:hypothetical protein
MRDQVATLAAAFVFTIFFYAPKKPTTFNMLRERRISDIESDTRRTSAETITVIVLPI